MVALNTYLVWCDRFAYIALLETDKVTNMIIIPTCLYIVVSNITVLVMVATFGQFGVSDPEN